MTARRYFVSGRVQGVSFRWFVQDEARELGLRGWVRNLADGRVEVWAEGPEGDLDRLKEKLRQGPRLAVVTDLREHPEEPTGRFGDFSIRF